MRSAIKLPTCEFASFNSSPIDVSFSFTAWLWYFKTQYLLKYLQQEVESSQNNFYNNMYSFSAYLLKILH
jgi:hypothetical protein